MTRYSRNGFAAALLGALTLSAGLGGSGLAATGRNTPAGIQPGVPETAVRPGGVVVQEQLSQLPLAFEANQGQSDPRVKFLCHGPGYSLFLTETESVLVLQAPLKCRAASRKGGRIALAAAGRTIQPPPESSGQVLRFKLIGADAHPRVDGTEPLPGRSNYFIGSDPAKWHTNIPQYARVTSAQVYPGIDLIYYGRQHRLEYDFQVTPGADPGAIRFAVDGASKADLDARGNLVLHGPGGDVIEQAPVIYQEINGERKSIAGSFELNPTGKPGTALAQSKIPALSEVGFRVPSYDRSKPLIIDPALVYSTYLGGSGRKTSDGLGSDGDYAISIAVDSSSNAYVTGYANSTNFPVTANAFQTKNKATVSQAAFSNVFVTKLNAAGTALIYSTYLGGSGGSYFESGDEGNGIAVDKAGCAYVTGETWSTHFPTTANAFQKSNNGTATGAANAFVSKLNLTGTALVYSTYLGGSGLAYTLPDAANPYGDAGTAIAVDGSGDAYVTGYAHSTNFPVTSAAYQKTKKVGLNSAVSYNAFVAKLNGAGTALDYSTYLGGSGESVGGYNGDEGVGIAVDGSGSAYVTGYTYSSDFPTTVYAFQKTNKAALHGTSNAFITKLGAAGRALDYSTYLGGSGAQQMYGPGSSVFYGDAGYGIAVDGAGAAYVTGEAFSTDFPTTANAYQKTNKAAANSASNAFVTKFGPAGEALGYSTYLGGAGRKTQDSQSGLYSYDGDTAYGIAVDGSGSAYVTGQAYSTNFPTTVGAYQTANKAAAIVSTNAFVTKLGPAGGALDYSTYLGGSGGDVGNSIVAGAHGTAYVTGVSYSTDFPITASAFQKTNNGINKTNGDDPNAFVTRINTE